VLRMEGAAVSVRKAAEQLQSIAADVSRSGRIQQLARIRSATDKVHQKVVSAGLAAGVLDEGLDSP